MKVEALRDGQVEDASRLNLEAFDDQADHRALFPLGTTPAAVAFASARVRGELAGWAAPGSNAAWHLVIADPHDGRILCYSFWFVKEDKPAEITYKPSPEANRAAFDARLAYHVRVHDDLMRGRGDHLYLATLVTAPEARRRGLAKLMLDWGRGKAADLKMPVFLTASPMGKSLYAANGYEELGSFSIDLSPHVDKPAGSVISTAVAMLLPAPV